MSVYRGRGKGSRSGSVGKWTGRVVVDLTVAEAIFETDIPAKIKLRTFTRSRDIYGKEFKGYSDEYGKARKRMGEISSRVTLHLTGGLLGSIGAWGEPVRTMFKTTVLISPKATASRVVRAPAPGAPGQGHYIETGKFGPPHNQILYWLGPGNKRGKRRIIMGLTPKESRELAREIGKKSGILKTKNVRRRRR